MLPSSSRKLFGFEVFWSDLNDKHSHTFELPELRAPVTAERRAHTTPFPPSRAVPTISGSPSAQVGSFSDSKAGAWRRLLLGASGCQRPQFSLSFAA